MLVWRWPILIGVATMLGLLAALIGDGIWDWLSALLLAIPVLLCGLFAFGPGRGKKRRQAP